MNTIAIILSLAVLMIILYLTDFKFELKFKKTNTGSDFEENKPELDKLSNTKLNILRVAKLISIQ